MVARYTESSEVWTVYSHANVVRLGADYNSGSALSRIVGLDNGAVATYNSGNSDLGQPISYRLITKWYEWEGIENQKVIQQLAGLCEKAQDGILMYQVDNETEWKFIGQLTKFMNIFDPILLKFHRIRFKFTGVTDREPPVFLGIEVIKGLSEGVVK